MQLVTRKISTRSTRIYTAITGVLLLLQGISTLAFRLYPPLDKAFPQLLGITRMILPHSILHILTGIAALAILFWGGERGTFWFATGFGLFYTGLALFGYITHHPTIFGLQPFDQPFHLFIGAWGLFVAGLSIYSSNIFSKNKQ
ncbi:MAG: hypothetical protein H7Y59_09875 [Anaerolineales bacterium]|nr:hypothetical protein [Anaerolineales bacterium]